MKRIIISLLATIAISVSFNCDKQSPVTPEDIILKAGSGKFGLSRMSGMDQQGMAKKSTISEVKTGTDASFDLGEIKGSSSFFFLLYNIGSKPITDISLTIPDNSFSVYPAKMDTLMPGTDMGMLPILKVNVFHGTQLDGVGYRPLMPKGVNTSVMRINGKTKTSDGVDTSISFEVDLNLKALVLDLDLQSSDGIIDLTKPSNPIMGNFPENIAQTSSYQQAGCDLTIKNNGNIPVSLKAYYRSMGSGVLYFSDTVSFTISIDSQVTFPNNNSDVFLSIDGSNTVSNPNKLPSHPNGRCYIYLNKSGTNCNRQPDTIINIPGFISFIEAQSKICSNVTNRMFTIDDSLVLWSIRGSCPGGINLAYRLYKMNPENIVGRYESTGIDGKSDTKICQSQAYCELLDLLRTNIADPNLGLGDGHKVKEITLK